MSKIYFLFIVFLVLISEICPAQSELKSDDVLLQKGKQHIVFNVPESDFQKLELSLDLQLNEDCIYDSGEFLSLKLPYDDSTSSIAEIEFARIYLASYNPKSAASNKIAYKFDLTMWQSMLQGNTEIIIDFNGESNDLNTAFSLNYEEGDPAVKVAAIIPLWQSDSEGFQYGKEGVSEDYLPSRNIQLPEKTYAAFINIRVSGIKNPETEKASSRFYFLSINKEEIAKRSIWREDCGLNPIYPQHDNWHTDHHNYCPGLRVNPLSHYINKDIIENKELEIDLRFQKDIYENSGVKAYVTSAVLFALAEPQEELNISISEIIAPNISLWHHRYNPICGNPIILIQNNGKEVVESIVLNYGYNYETDNKFKWKGQLGFMEQEIIYLPSLNWYFYDKSDKPESFTAHISKVNGEEKAFIGGKKTSKMEVAPVYPYKLTFEIETADGALFNGLEIFNEDGKAMFISEELEDNKKYSFDISLIPGCYEMIFYDEEGNGIHFEDSKTPCLIIKKQKNGVILKEYSGDFGREIREQFMVFR